MQPHVPQSRQMRASKADVEFFTRLTIDDCRQRLLQAMDRPWMLIKLGGSKPVWGNVTDDRFFLRERTYYVDPWNPVLNGILTPAPHGTHVSASFRSNAGSNLLIAIALFPFACTVLALIVFNQPWLREQIQRDAAFLPMYFVVAVGVLIMSVVAIYVMNREHKSARQYLIRHLSTILFAINHEPFS